MTHYEIGTHHTDDFIQEWEHTTVMRWKHRNLHSWSKSEKSFWHSWLTCNRATLQQLRRPSMKYLFEWCKSAEHFTLSIYSFPALLLCLKPSCSYFRSVKKRKFLLSYKNRYDLIYGKKTKHGIVNYGSYHALHKLENVLQLANTWPA
jgi:hypothetical protein